MTSLNIYFYFSPVNNTVADSANSAREFADMIVHSINRADCEKGSKLYFDKSSCDQLITSLEMVDEIFEDVGVLKFSQYIILLLEDISAHYWQDSPLHDLLEADRFYKVFNSSSRQIENSCLPVFKEIAERFNNALDKSKEKFVIVSLDGSDITSDSIDVIRGARNSNPSMFRIEIVKDFLALERWIYKNIERRQYNMNDYRHCRDHKDCLHHKSPLIGGQAYRSTAAKLLEDALGDKKEKDYIVVFDPNKNRYLRFEFENNPENGYHGYHLADRKTFENDNDAIALIPPRIKSILKYRESLENAKNK